MCEFCKTFDFNTIGVENLWGHMNLFTNSGGVKPENRVHNCPMCGRPLTDEDFVKPTAGCPLGHQGCIHAPAKAYKCLYKDLDEYGCCQGFEVK